MEGEGASNGETGVERGRGARQGQRGARQGVRQRLNKARDMHGRRGALDAPCYVWSHFCYPLLLVNLLIFSIKMICTKKPSVPPLLRVPPALLQGTRFISLTSFWSYKLKHGALSSLAAVGSHFHPADVFMGCNAARGSGPMPPRGMPGVGAVGIGFDAVYGTSRGVGRQVANFSFTEPGQTWTDPFGNQTAYSFPDQAKVTQETTQFVGHQIYRSVNEYVQQQSANADVRVGIGPWFSASVDTQNAHSVMKDGLRTLSLPVSLPASSGSTKSPLTPGCC